MADVDRLISRLSNDKGLKLRDDQKIYWDDRFKRGGEIWGEEPCAAALEAERIFKSHGVSKLLVLGCGYGRNCLFFAKKGFQVVGLDISTVAIEMAKVRAKKESLSIRYIVDDILNFSLDEEVFEGIFCFNTLHFFSEAERERISDWLIHLLSKGGILVLASMSTRDGDFGKGEKVAENTFESKKGRPIFYFNEDSIRDLFDKRLHIKDLREIQEQENHDGKAHTHWIWFLSGARK
ncbi:MAG: class I SAM-dependent methyltransferase [Thermodesulfobacteriota bacterium]